MSLLQVWGALLIFVLCPLLGGLPLTGWITQLISGKKLAKMGTGNVGVSAAFYHGGRVAGVLAVLSEALKGIAAVLLARYFFPLDPAWEVISLIALVMGRFWIGKGAGTTNVVWGFIVHDWVTALLTFLISGIGFTIFRERKQGRLVSLVLLPVLTALRHADEGDRVFLVACLSGLIAWVYQKLPDDLDLSANEGRVESQTMFRFFRGDRALLSLDQALSADKVGNKAATLAQLKAWGYPVPRGYVLPAGDDLNPLIEITEPSTQHPIAVRSSAMDEDTGTASAAGLYTSILNVTSKEALESAIQQCFISYNNPGAVQYRKDRNLPEQGLAVLVQEQVQGVFSGVAFSRDPIARSGDAVVIEALPGAASQVVSGQQTPEQYRVLVGANDVEVEGEQAWQLPAALTLPVEGEGQVPSRLIQQVAYLARHLEARYHGIPQDIEWSFDGETLWLLQSRPITTLQPIWTRKIAAEVIPGSIRPLTWSINRPLTCGVWGEIFTLVLGNRAEGLDFEETATLHHSYAYFNATLLGDIFLRMGLPPESLEFLTRGAKFSKPPLSSTLKNVPGLLRLAGRELSLEKDFKRDCKTLFQAGMQTLAAAPRESLSPLQLLERIETVLSLLKRATYYSIFSPLSFAVREGLFKVPPQALDAGQNPEVGALKELAAIATDIRRTLPASTLATVSSASDLMTVLSEHPEAQPSRLQLEQFITTYGYLSEVGTDIAVPNWQENPAPVQELLTQYVLSPPNDAVALSFTVSGWKQKSVQRRLDLKGQVNALYSQLLAELRTCFLVLENRWITEGLLTQSGDIFFLIYDEIQVLVNQPETLRSTLAQRIEARKQQFETDRQVDAVPTLVFGNEPPRMNASAFSRSPLGVAQTLKGIGASPGIIEGTIRVMRQMGSLEGNSESIILVVPYTDAGWAPLLARADGLIAEVGGRLSHGAIVAREYGIPAIMDVTEATQRLHNGQRVRIDGAAGTVEVLEG